MPARRRPRLAAAAAATALAVLVAGAASPATAMAGDAGSASAAMGDVAATATWEAAEFGVSKPKLTIVRSGASLFDATPYLGATCEEGCDILTTSTRKSPLQVRDLDGDGEPEVLLDAYTGGAHCCSVTYVYAFDPAAAGGAGGYTGVEAFWGNLGYSLRDLDGDGRPELVSADDAFAYAFTAYAFSFFPPKVLAYDRTAVGSLRDVTRRFPAVIRSHARDTLRALRSGRRKSYDVRGAVAAYVADQYLLGRPRTGLRYLDRALRRGYLRGEPGGGWPSGRSFKPALLRFLKKFGYR